MKPDRRTPCAPSRRSLPWALLPWPIGLFTLGCGGDSTADSRTSDVIRGGNGGGGAGSGAAGGAATTGGANGSGGDSAGGAGGALSSGGTPGSSGLSNTGGSGTGGIGTGGFTACPPCAAPPSPDCIGTGPCGCGPYVCPDAGTAGSCGGEQCGAGSFCCGPPECGFCAPEASGVSCPNYCEYCAGAYYRSTGSPLCTGSFTALWEANTAIDLSVFFVPECQDAGTNLPRYCCTADFVPACP